MSGLTAGTIQQIYLVSTHALALRGTCLKVCFAKNSYGDGNEKR